MHPYKCQKNNGTDESSKYDCHLCFLPTIDFFTCWLFTELF